MPQNKYLIFLIVHWICLRSPKWPWCLLWIRASLSTLLSFSSTESRWPLSLSYLSLSFFCCLSLFVYALVHLCFLCPLSVTIISVLCLFVSISNYVSLFLNHAHFLYLSISFSFSIFLPRPLSFAFSLSFTIVLYIFQSNYLSLFLFISLLVSLYLFISLFLYISLHVSLSLSLSLYIYIYI